jgi:hypothetical protein
MLLQMIAEVMDQRNCVSLKGRQDLLFASEVSECGVHGPRDGVSAWRVLGGHDQRP